MSDCRGCDGTCCTGVGSEACSCEPREVETPPQGPAMKNLLRVLSGVQPARWQGSQERFHCPAHRDQSPSLVVREITGGLLIKCCAGCSTDQVLTSLGLTTADLFNNHTNQD